MANVEIKVLKQSGFYKKEGKKKQYTNYYLQLNNERIPIEVKYFAQDKFGGRDPGYQGRVAALSLIAEALPDIPFVDSDEKGKSVNINPENIVCPKCGKVMRVDDKDDTTYYLLCDDCGIGSKFDTKVGELSFTDSDGNEIPF